MNQALSKKQLCFACLLVLSLASLALFLFFKTPANSDFDYDTQLLHNTAITSLTINRESLTSPVLTNKNPESLLGPLPLSYRLPTLTPEEKQAQELQEQREQKQFDDAVAYLKNEGLAVALDRNPAGPTEDDSPINVIIELKGTGTRVAGRPTWGSYGYTVALHRWVYLASGSRGLTRVKVELLSGELGIVSPETLPKREAEALGMALEGLAKEWKRCNPAAGKKP